jgi:hypothetical protein
MPSSAWTSLALLAGTSALIATAQPSADKPPWLGCQEGLLAEDEVPWPWTPLQVEGNTVKCWGREYRFADTGLPEQIASAGREMLAGPIRLVGSEGEPSRALRVTGARAHADVKGSTASGWVEYDGVVSMDVSVPPPAQGATFEIPLKPEQAKYFHFWPGGWGTVYNSGAIPAEGMKIPFKPWVWIGDEERGLAWFCESDKGWDPLDRQDCIEIAREGAAVVLRIHLRTPDAEPLAEPITYTFGLQATPVKPWPKDYHSWHICHGAYYGMESAPWSQAGTLSYPMAGNLDPASGTLEAWVTPMFDPNVEVKEGENRGMYNREFVRFNLADGTVASLYWNIDDRGMRFYVREPGERYPIVLGSHSDWQKGETHHVALTWGDAIRIYVDRELRAEQAFEGLFGREADVADGEILFGGGPGEFVVDEIRILSVARAEFELATLDALNARLLLVDHLDDTFDPDGKRRTQAGSGLPSPGTRFVEGKFGRALQLFDDTGPATALDRAKQLGVRTIIFHESWTDIQDYVETTHKEQLHSLVRACHERGMKILLYFGYEMSDIAPEWDDYHQECLVFPRAGGYKRQPPQTAYIVCYRSHWTDFMAKGIAHMMDEYDIDGVYLDGTSEPWGCSNERHGCGYRAPDGSLRPTYPMLAVRDHLRRLYMIVKRRKPDGHVNVHQSTCNVMTSLAYATSYWDGEQLGGMPEAEDPLDVLPLDAFRAEFMGRQWGVPAEFLCYTPRPYTTTEAHAFTLPHDVLIHPSFGTQLEEVAQVWRAFEQFGVDEAQWIPYWRDDSPARAAARGILVSLYRRDGRALLVVSNLRNSAGLAQVQLDTQALGIGREPRAADAVTGEGLEVVDRTLRVPMERFSARLVVIE